jgi:GT2 family glycosyltransferase
MDITVVVPTMWLAKEFEVSLEILHKAKRVSEVVVIDNGDRNMDFSRYGPRAQGQPIERYGKRIAVDQYGKFKMLRPGRNIYVTEPWNIGARLAAAEIVCLLNDDVIPQEEAFDFASELIASDKSVGIVSVGGECYGNASHANTFRPTPNREYGFGCCMFFLKEKFVEIPTEIRIWFNDDFLFRKIQGTHCALTGAVARGGFSTTTFSPSVWPQIAEIVKKDEEAYWLLKG